MFGRVGCCCSFCVMRRGNIELRVACSITASSMTSNPDQTRRTACAAIELRRSRSRATAFGSPGGDSDKSRSGFALRHGCRSFSLNVENKTLNLSHDAEVSVKWCPWRVSFYRAWLRFSAAFVKHHTGPDGSGAPAVTRPSACPSPSRTTSAALHHGPRCRSARLAAGCPAQSAKRTRHGWPPPASAHRH